MDARAITERLFLLGRAQVDIENAEYLTPQGEAVSTVRLNRILKLLGEEMAVLKRQKRLSRKTPNLEEATG